ncbi:MAG: ATP-binding protein [Maribacter sp.]
MNSEKNKFTFKITFSYLLLIILGAIASYYIYNEVRDYITQETVATNESKLLKTNSFLAQLYEAESLSKIALQTKNKLNFEAYENKIDSITDNINQLKEYTESEHQQGLLDSLTSLLDKKVKNINALRNLRIENQTGKAISSAINEFDKMEESLGIITPEGLAPNLKELSPKAQEAIKKVADYLNANIPNQNSPQQKDLRVDSVLQVSKNLLKEVAQENSLNENSLAKSETDINRTDLELSQQLRTILTSFEQEIVMNSMATNAKKESLLKRSIRLASIAALLGFLVVGIFTFILNRDFWKANLYREKLEKEKEYSESLLKSREQLIATVSHDLRTPLTTINGYATLLEESGTEKDKDYVTQIKSASNYVNNLVNDLLDFSQLEAGKMVAKSTTFRLNQLIKECASNIASQYETKNIQLVLDLDESLDKPIVTDDFRLRQILNNLLGNSYKFTEEGSITLTGKIIGKSKSKRLLLEITDTGIGISKEKQQLIFAEFTQADSTTEHKYGGYGLGLTITKKLTELLNGTISLKSEFGKGSTFILELPVEYGVISQEVVQENIPLENLKILVFDDDTSFLKLVGEMFKSEGIEASLLTDFNEYPSIPNFEFDLVLTDIEMPTLTGYEILSKLKSGAYPSYVQQPIIAMTGRRDLSLEHFTDAGFAKLLRKPFSKTELLQKLNELFSNSKPTAEIKPIQSTRRTSKEFSLETIKMFLGDDQDAVDEILYTFKKDTLENIKQLSDAAANNNTTQISQIAHRMLPMFRQLEVVQVIPILENFEGLNTTNYSHEKLKDEYLTLEKHFKKLLKEL